MKKIGGLLIIFGFLVIWGAVGYSELEATVTITETVVKAGGGFLLIGIGVQLFKRGSKKNTPHCPTCQNPLSLKRRERKLKGLLLVFCRRCNAPVVIDKGRVEIASDNLLGFVVCRQ